MRIVFVNQYYWPDYAATAQMLTDLAEYAAQLGHDVHVVASTQLYVRNGHGRLAREEVHGDVHVHRVRTTHFGRLTLLHRAADYLSFYGRAVARIARLPRPDAVVLMTTPPLLGTVGTLLHHLRGTPYLLWLMDLYPELAHSFGVLRPGSLAGRLFERVALQMCRDAAGLITLCDDMRRQVAERGISPERITVVRNWANGEAVRPMPSHQSTLRRQLGIDGQRLLFGYSGNFGRAHVFEPLLEVLRRRGADDRIGFLFVGGGPRYEQVRRFCEERRLANVWFQPYQHRELLTDSLAAADVHLITQDPAVDGLLVPSKLYGILAAARPCLFIGSPATEVGRCLQQLECGFTRSPEDVEGIDQAIEELLTEPAARQAMARRAREGFERHYDMRPNCERVLKTIRAAIGRVRPAQPVR